MISTLPGELAWGAEDILKANGINPETMKLKDIESEYRQICSDRDKTYAEYKNAEKDIGEPKEQTITET